MYMVYINNKSTILSFKPVHFYTHAHVAKYCRNVFPIFQYFEKHIVFVSSISPTYASTYIQGTFSRHQHPTTLNLIQKSKKSLPFAHSILKNGAEKRTEMEYSVGSPFCSAWKVKPCFCSICKMLEKVERVLAV